MAIKQRKKLEEWRGREKGNGCSGKCKQVADKEQVVVSHNACVADEWDKELITFMVQVGSKKAKQQQ